ncbi:MAG TPA: ComF family protein [Anaeromyxobacteraceae bacterium]|nr:ComF family protein [Anaeromyxobacteraceae bacterium]
MIQLVTDLLDLCFPPSCAACREPLGSSRAGPFCAVCADAVEPVPPGCPRCGLPGQEAAACGACRLQVPAFDGCVAGALFGGPMADAVHALKYCGRAAIAGPLGAWLAAAAPLPRGADVVSVPLARRRRIERGYDQAALLADSVARAARLPRLRSALRRVRETPPQVGRSRDERFRNVAGAFTAAAAVRGRDLLLVDDVVTTGATASACAEALRAAGARSIAVLALARAE